MNLAVISNLTSMRAYDKLEPDPSGSKSGKP